MLPSIRSRTANLEEDQASSAGFGSNELLGFGSGLSDAHAMASARRCRVIGHDPVAWNSVTTVEDTTAGPAELTGTFDGFALSELFELFVATAASGSLTLGEPVNATLWITDGKVSYGTSPGTPDPRELLERQGIVDAHRFDAAVANTVAGGRLHESLAALDDVDPDRIASVAREQIVTTAFEIIAVGAERFEFRSGRPDPLGGIVGMDPAEMLAEAEHRRDEWRRIAELIPSTALVTAPTRTLPAGRASVTITAPQWQVLALLDGRRNAADIIGILGRSAYEVCVVLHDLLESRTIEVIDPAADIATGTS